ncbi:HAD family hydrolase [Halalkalicoccus ordinarius]|uniref:HAD family hydrolase n=1 Tax=Halalkalicoccus ordinarius TaxID=3116651 RepID=UPI00300EF9CB
MERYDLLYRLYEEFEADTLRAYQDFVEVFPPIDSRVALEHWRTASDELARRKDAISGAFDHGDVFAEIAAHATREQAFSALDLHSKYGRAVNVLVLDVDETLRSAGNTDNEIPRETLALLTEFHEGGVPIVICTGQTLENVKGFMIQGLGSEIVHSGAFSIVYEAGTGVFTPNHGAETKRLLYEDLEESIVSIFDALRSRVLREAPEELRRGCHLQGNEFNVTMKPNFETGSPQATDLIDDALVYELDLLAEVLADRTDDPPERVREWTRAFYAEGDSEIRTVLEGADATSEVDPDEASESVLDLLERIDVAYYEGDAAEIGSRELNKVVGIEAALEVLGVEDPFALVMGDSKSDLRVMEWAADGRGIAAAPEHASQDVLEHVLGTDELLFNRGRSADVLRTVYALNRLTTVTD